MADETKPVLVSPNALIKVGGNNFMNMTDASQLTSLEQSAPAFHRRVVDALKASGKVRAEDPIVAQAQRHSQPEFYRPQQQKMRFTTGAIVQNKAGKRLTIIKASAGHTRKNNIPVHRVADKNGKVWLERENDLKLLV